ncbi:VWA domain-containing protein [Ideonella sp. 4Y11]|uniref:VWA domain-containing protein n=1 Tax=Ideonella aquatica TaxID=2824119 RepID=A0A941BI38_9BURK|nr:VWA domain-containing protein [Ideonella aquatica]MBQ0961556.1 VWA domain-containing protein [Ideonella aquatica]
MLAPQASTRHPLWRERLGRVFPEVEAVFDDALDRGLPLLSDTGAAKWMDLCAWLARLGRGPEPVLAALEAWPEVAAVAGEAAYHPLREAIGAFQKSPNGRAIAPLLQSLPAVARRLPSEPALRRYLQLVVGLMQRTSVSIHGRHATEPSPGLPALLQAAPRLVAQVPLEGLARWIEAGIRAHGGHPQRQIAFFAAESDDSRALLQRERHGTLLMDLQRRLQCTLQSLWQWDATLVPQPVDAEAPLPQPWLANDGDADTPLWGLRLPEVLDTFNGVSASTRYRLMIGHLALHRRHGQALVADNWSPLQRLAVECFEDARIDRLLLQRCPGLRGAILALHPCPLLDSVDESHQSGLRVRLTRLSHALLFGAPKDELEDHTLAAFDAALAEGADSAAMARLALAWAARSRRASDQFADVVFRDTQVDWRDDNRHLWRFIEDGDEEQAFDDEARRPPPADEQGLPPRRHPEWDEAAQQLRPDWVSVYDHLQPAGDASEIECLLQRHAGTARHLQRLLQHLRPQDRARLRRQDEGSELDLDAAVRALVDARASGQAVDSRVQMSTRPEGRRFAVTLLLDLSASVNDPVPGAAGETVLSLSRAAVALLAQAVDALGDQLAIVGFHSNTRHEVRLWHLKGFGERWSDGAPAARLAGVQGAFSTRLGAALRHAGDALLARPADQRLMLVLTDGVPSDVDAPDPLHLVADAAHAVRTLAGQGLPVHAVSVDRAADDYLRRIFGKRFSVVDRVEQLPRRLPEVFAALTR